MIDDPKIRALVVHQSTEPVISFYRSREFDLERGSASDEERLRAARDLEALCAGIARLLQSLLEAGEFDGFDKALSSWNEDRRRETLAQQLDDLRFYLSHAADDRKRELEKKISALQPIADASRRVRVARASALVQLGGWMAAELTRRAAADAGPTRDALTGSLKRIAGAAGEAEDVLAVLSDYFSGTHRFELLDSWHSHEMMAAGRRSWSGDNSGDGLYFAAILLVRLINVGDKVVIEPTESAGSVRHTMQRHLDAVLQNRERWSFLLPEDAEARVKHIADELEAAEARQAEQERRRVAEAPLSADVVLEFRTSNSSSFRDARVIAGAFRRATRLVQTPDAEAFSRRGRVVREYLPKEWFVGGDRVINLTDDVGREMARDQDSVLFEALREAAFAERVSLPELPARILAFAEAIESVDQDHALVLAPLDFRLRQAFSSDELFKADADSGWRGTLGHTPIYFVPVADSAPVLAIDLTRTSLIEYLVPGDESPLMIVVEPVSAEAAEKAALDGFRMSDGQDDDAQTTARRLRAERVLLDARTAFELAGELGDNLALEWAGEQPSVEPIERG